MANKHAFKVTFTDEAEVFGKAALKNNLIPEYFHAGVVAITNAGASTVFIGFGLEAMADWEGQPLGASDGVSPGGTVIIDLKAANASTGIIRAKVLGGGTGILSFFIL